MIRNALGPSPLEKNAHALAEILPSVSVESSARTRAVAWAIAAFRQAGADEVHVEKFGSGGEFENVVAEFRGRENPQDCVLIAASLDDAAANPLVVADRAALLVDAARVIHATGTIPRRSIRFVLFDAASHGPDGRLAGQWAYLSRHHAGLDRIAAAVSMGAASGPLNGFSLEDRPDTLKSVQLALEPLRSLGIRKFTQHVGIPTDVTPFWLEGVPTLIATSSPAGRDSKGQPPAGPAPGAIPLAKLQQLKRRVAVAAVTAFALADAEARIGPRRSPSEVHKSVESMGLASKLKSDGLWSPWQSVRSGAPH
jgi:carboxypeptidase Q